MSYECCEISRSERMNRVVKNSTRAFVESTFRGGAVFVPGVNLLSVYLLRKFLTTKIRRKNISTFSANQTIGRVLKNLGSNEIVGNSNRCLK